MRKSQALAIVLLTVPLVGCASKPKEFKEVVAEEARKQDLATPSLDTSLSITVSIDNERKIYLNREPVGTIEDVNQLRQKLPQLFAEKGHKTVFIAAPHSATNEELAKVIDAVKESGAHPIGLSQGDR